jgi:hypothetical protein
MMRFTLLLALTTLASGQDTATPQEASLSMVSPGNRVVLKVKDGELKGATVNGQAVPLDRVQVEGGGLRVVDADGKVIGSMAQLPKDGPAALKPMAQKAAKVDVFTDNPELDVRIVNSRELQVKFKGVVVPPSQIVMDKGELRIFNAAGDLLRIIPADSSRLSKRAE